MKPWLTESEIRQLPNDTYLIGDGGTYHLSVGVWYGPAGRPVSADDVAASVANYKQTSDIDRGETWEVEECPHCGGYLDDSTECLTCGWWPGAGPGFGRE